MNLSALTWLKEGAVDLLVESYSNSARTLQIRGFTENEQIIADHTTNSDRTRATSVISVTDAPVMLNVRSATTGVKSGECYVEVSLRVEGVIVAMLGCGYVTDTSTVMWPGGMNESSLAGPGLVRSITGTNPAAQVELSETVPTGAIWVIDSIKVLLVTDANVANRFCFLTIDDGTNEVFRAASLASITASLTWNLIWSTQGSQSTGSSSSANSVLPITMMVPGGYRIKTTTSSLQVGDNFGAPQLFVREWILP